MARAHRLGAGVEQRKTAGAVGRLHHAGREAALPDGRGLLVAGDAEDADRAAEQLGRGRAEIGGAIAHLRQQPGRDPEHAGERIVPLAAANIEQQRARRVGRIGAMDLAAGQPPQQEAVDRAEGEPPLPGRGARAGDVIEQPGDLGGGEIRIEQQPGLVADGRRFARRPQRGAVLRGAAVLPDDGVVDRPAGRALPDDRGLALVGDADGGHILGREPGLGHGVAHRRDDARPDLLRIVLDPAGLRIDLPQLLLGARDRRERAIEHDGARRGRALIDGDDVGHGAMLARFGFPRKGEMGWRRAREEFLRRRTSDARAANSLTLPWRGRVGERRAKRDASRGGVNLPTEEAHPTPPLAHFVRFASTLPLQGRVKRVCRALAMQSESQSRERSPPIHVVKQPCEIRRGLWSAPRWPSWVPPWHGEACPLAKPRGGAPIGATCSVHALAGVRAPLAKGRCAHRRSARRFTVSGSRSR